MNQTIPAKGGSVDAKKFGDVAVGEFFYSKPNILYMKTKCFTVPDKFNAVAITGANCDKDRLELFRDDMQVFTYWREEVFNENILWRFSEPRV